MPSRHMEKGSTSAVIGEIQIKMTVSPQHIYYDKNEINSIVNVDKDMEQLELSHTAGRNINF